MNGKCSYLKCNNEFETKYKNQKYCSYQCANRHRVQKHRKNKHAICPKCDQKMAFDSIQCRKCCKTDLSVRTIESLGKNSTHQAARVRQHARDVWINSGKPLACHICNYSNHYEVAHIHPISSFQSNTLLCVVNHINNLLALCPNHHWELDNHLLKMEG